MDIGRIIDLIRLPLRYMISITIISSILLFSTEVFLGKMGLEELVNDYRMWIGLIFIVSLGFSLSNIAISSWNSICRKRNSDKLMKLRIKRLHELTAREKEILSYFIRNQTRTHKLSYSDGTVHELEAFTIIKRTSNLGSVVGGFSYNIQPWAWDYLNKNKHLLE